ncbi:MAG: cadherin domain-containing protein, partial [Chloroflexota bacterium]|nr:cadherin domain-containing protein [Chloroflexota bacterium]
MTITVLNINEAPVITTTGTAFTTISAPEGTLTTEALVVYEADEPEVGFDTITWTLAGDDAARFTITGNTTGEARLRFQALPDFESPLDAGANNVFNVTVQVRDNKINIPGNTNGNPDTDVDDSISVVVTVTNLDEAGTVTITGTESGGETLTASVTDIDGTVSSLSWQWARGDSASGPFTNITSNGTSADYTTIAADVGKFLRATASYTDPQGSGKSANAVTGQIGASNVEPSFSSMTATRSVAENSGSGVNVGAVVSATSGDSDSLRYTLSGTDASSFTIVATSGQIQTTNVNYNYESKNSYTVIVNVSDNKDAAGNSDSNSVDDSITVTINLNDVNEQPAISTTQTAISVADNQTSVLTYAADDPDNENNESHDSANTLTWSVESADDGDFFEIGSTSGVLTFKNAPNFEDRQDAGGDGVYNVTVTVTDNGIDGNRGSSNHLSVSKSLAVTVTDINETPTLTTAPSSITFDENATGVVATYIATDPDATTGQMTWDLSGNDAGDFNITSTVNGTAELRFKNPPDFERPEDTGGNSVYDVTVRVRDNGSPRLEDTQSVSVGVTDLNETPVVSGNAGPSFAEIEFDHTATASELVIGTYTATDDDNADNAGIQTITFDVTGTDAAHFSINANTGVLSFSIEPDFENPADLADSNMMGASDNMYEVVVRANDGQGGTGIEESVGTFNVTVTVTNVNETPEVPAGVPDEDFAEIEWDADSADLDVMTYISRDEETSTADLTLAITWSLAGTDAADFQILRDITTGHGTLSFRNRPNFENPTDRLNTAESHAADDNMYEVIVKLSDGPNTRDYPMTVTVTNVNETPEFTRLVGPGLHANEIEYDSGITAADLAALPATIANQSLVYPFEARDEEGDDISWTLTGGDAADFVITENPNLERPDSDEGALVRWNIVPDYENPLGSGSGGTEFYHVTVNASDGVNTSEWDFFVRIDDVNERPEFTGTPTATVSLDEHDATLDASFAEPPYAFPVIASYTGRDEEGGVTWSLTGTDAADFEIDSGGNVTFKETPSFEDPKDSGGDNV